MIYLSTKVDISTLFVTMGCSCSSIDHQVYRELLTAIHKCDLGSVEYILSSLRRPLNVNDDVLEGLWHSVILVSCRYPLLRTIPILEALLLHRTLLPKFDTGSSYDRFRFEVREGRPLSLAFMRYGTDGYPILQDPLSFSNSLGQYGFATGYVSQRLEEAYLSQRFEGCTSPKR